MSRQNRHDFRRQRGQGVFVVTAISENPIKDGRAGLRIAESGERHRAGRVRVLVVGEWALFRSALAALLDAEDGIEVVAESEVDSGLAVTALRLQPDVAVVDIDLPNDDGLTAARTLAEHVPGCGVVVLTVSSRPGLLRRALEAHALGFVDKNASAGHLAASVRQVAAGDQVVDPNLAVAAVCTAGSPFTAREIDVLRIAAEGVAAPEIARRLCLTRGTVRNYLSRIMGKTGAHTRLEAVRIARETGWC